MRTTNAWISFGGDGWPPTGGPVTVLWDLRLLLP